MKIEDNQYNTIDSRSNSLESRYTNNNQYYDVDAYNN